ncbi:MAG TPA: hypothetical protein VF168_12470 [Trueperaceae bacterium]
MELSNAASMKEVAELLLAARGRIDFYWNFYLAVVVAVVGWLLSRKSALTMSTKVLVTVVYLVAASMNLMGLVASYALAEALREDLLTIESTHQLANTRLLLEEYSYLPQRSVALAVHLLVAAMILYIVWSGRSFGRVRGPTDSSA